MKETFQHSRPCVLLTSLCFLLFTFPWKKKILLISDHTRELNKIKVCFQNDNRSQLCNKHHVSITADSLNKPHATVAHCTPSCQLYTQGSGWGGVCLWQHCQGQKGADTEEQSSQGRTLALHFFPRDTDQKVKLAADKIKHEAGEEEEQSAGKDSSEPRGKMVRVELEWDIPMSVTLPVQVHPDPVDQPFPFLETTLADLGIKEWVCAVGIWTRFLFISLRKSQNFFMTLHVISLTLPHSIDLVAEII